MCSNLYAPLTLTIWASLVDQWWKESTCQCRRHRLYPWVRKILWRRIRLPTSVFLPGKPRGQRSLVGYRPWRRKRVGHASGTQQQPSRFIWSNGNDRIPTSLQHPDPSKSSPEEHAPSSPPLAFDSCFQEAHLSLRGRAQLTYIWRTNTEPSTEIVVKNWKGSFPPKYGE